MTQYETLKQLVAEVEDDIRKAEGGNKAAGTRVRKKMMDIRNTAQEIRKAILAGREGEEGGEEAGGAGGENPAQA